MCEKGLHLECLRREIKTRAHAPVEISEGVHRLVIDSFRCDHCFSRYERESARRG